MKQIRSHSPRLREKKKIEEPYFDQEAKKHKLNLKQTVLSSVYKVGGGKSGGKREREGGGEEE